MKTILTLLFWMSCLTVFAQKRATLNINYMLRGQMYAGSEIEDTNASGGFGSSRNMPHKINADFKFNETGLLLKIDTTQLITIEDKYNGYKLHLVNNTGKIAEFTASDSRLSIVAQVFYENKWQPIEYLPSSKCGNSYHSVYLKPHTFWTFTIPIFSGTIPVRLRYILTLGKDKSIYSNEIRVRINKGQLEEKQGHKPTDVMDPYNE